MTEEQFNALYAGLAKQQNDILEYHAVLHGAEIKKETTAPKKETRNTNSNALPVFGDPEEYANLSEEERHNLTSSMTKAHKNWVATKKA